MEQINAILVKEPLGLDAINAQNKNALNVKISTTYLVMISA